MPNTAKNKSDCRCTRCGAYSKHWKSELSKSNTVRCVCCGGNVVLARYVFDADLDPTARAQAAPASNPDAKVDTRPMRRVQRPARRHRNSKRSREKPAIDREYLAIVKDGAPPVAKPAADQSTWIKPTTRMPFAPYRGKMVKDVPLSYLRWFSVVPPNRNSTEGTEAFKRELRRYLKNR